MRGTCSATRPTGESWETCVGFGADERGGVWSRAASAASASRRACDARGTSAPRVQGSWSGCCIDHVANVIGLIRRRVALSRELVRHQQRLDLGLSQPQPVTARQSVVKCRCASGTLPLLSASFGLREGRRALVSSSSFTPDEARPRRRTASRRTTHSLPTMSFSYRRDQPDHQSEQAAADPRGRRARRCAARTDASQRQASESAQSLPRPGFSASSVSRKGLSECAPSAEPEGGVVLVQPARS